MFSGTLNWTGNLYLPGRRSFKLTDAVMEFLPRRVRISVRPSTTTEMSFTVFEME